ncbi:type II secretion system protein [Clostridium sp. AL.422]|uniref:type II secretion system protein n=1 Tax=Clostridium TaxID=1485 RepID=UPI00293DB959|nr:MULTISPECIES: type II secretion system protein [unclassified Clostridium]MDV4149359.1 type II secretion system protein [Clostridium sp. AL.422]
MKSQSKSKREKIIKIQKRLIAIISVILAITLIISFNNYKKTTKKIEIKESARELILTAEVVEINEGIKFDNSDTIADIKNEGGDKLEAIKKYKDIDTFNKIEVLTLEDAKKIINNEVDFIINKEGKFLRIEINN